MKTLLTILTVSILTCSSNWSIAGYELSPQDTTAFQWKAIVDSNAVQHLYADSVINGDNYCHYHGWEHVQAIER